MGNTYFPPKKWTDPNIQTGHPPASERLGGPDAVSPGSQEVVHNNSDLIGAFVYAQRQNVANSSVDYHRSSTTTPNADVHYTNHRGHEQIRVDPHPQGGAPVDDKQTISAPNALVEIARQEIVTPDTPLFLMVLFQQSGIAGFSMENLSATGAGEPKLLGKAPGSEWVDTLGKIITVGQYRLAGTGWILTQLDFTGQTSARTLYISTIALGDAVATQGDIQAMPVMNSAVPKSVFTVGGAFSYDPQKAVQFTQTLSMPQDGGVTVGSYAISQDGTSYFFTSFLGADITIQLDPKSQLGYSYSNAFSFALYNAEQPLLGTLPTPAIHTVVKSKSTDAVSTGRDYFEQNYTINILLVGNGATTGFIDGVSYYGKAPFGLVPGPENVKVAQSEQDVEVYDITVNHTVIKQTPVGLNIEFGGDFWLQTYTFGTSGGSDTVSVTPFQISATGSTSQPLTQNTDKTKFTSLFPPVSHSASANRFDTSGGTTTQTIISVSSSDVPGVPYPPNPGVGGNLGADVAGAEAVYTTLLSLGQGAPDLKDQRTYVATTLTVDQQALNDIYVDTGDFATPDQAPFPPGTDSSTTTVGGVLRAQAAIDLHWPYQLGSTGPSFDRKSTIIAFNQNLTYSYVRSPSFNTDDVGPPSMTVHTHPPAFSFKGNPARPYWTIVRPSKDPTDGHDTTTWTVGTPYAQHAAKNPQSFTPWLHVSNGQHVIQAYYVDGTPHCFVDGSTKEGFLASIAKMCKCKTTEIVAMYMDITAVKIQAVAKIKPPDYSHSQSAAPGKPGQ